MRELELCFVTNRCSDCPASMLGTELGSAAIATAQKVYAAVGNEQESIVEMRIPGVKQLVGESFGIAPKDTGYHPITEAAQIIVWWSATGKCRSNFNKLTEGE